MRWSPDLQKTIRLLRRKGATQSNCGKARLSAGERAGELKDAVKFCAQSGLSAPDFGRSGGPALVGRPSQYSAIARLGRFAGGLPHDASMVSGFRLASRASNLFSALTYARADATMVSVSEPRPVTVLPSASSRTVTSAWASVPSVTALT